MASRWKRTPRVNCWFCNEDFNIEFDKEDGGWDCPGCQQYNGFTEEGDYDRPIPDQYENNLSKGEKSYCQREAIVEDDSILCRFCHQNQALKVGQLASFVPLSEASYNEEVETYEEYLESVYRLCQRCKDRVRDHIALQDEDIFKTLEEEDNLQIKQTGIPERESNCSRTSQGQKCILYWITPSFLCLCLMMAVINTSLSMGICVEMEKNRLNGIVPPCVYTAILYTASVVSLPAVQSMSQLPLYLGAGFCLLGLLAVGKKCVHIVDALHILHWLALLVTNVLSPAMRQNVYTASSYLVLCISTTSMCYVCLTKSRQPKKFSEVATQSLTRIASHKKVTPLKEKHLPDCNGKITAEPQFVSTISSLPPCPSPSSSFLVYPVGEAKNFFKPISSSPPSSPTSMVSSASPDGVSSNQEKSKSTYDTVRDGLESISLGLARKSGSMSSIWSLPSIISSDPSTSCDSTVPTTTSATTTTTFTTHNNNNNNNNNIGITEPLSRNILTPSRLNIISFSLSPSPGKFSSSSPGWDKAPECSPASLKHKSQDADISSSKNDSIPPKSSNQTNSSIHSTSPQQLQSFTKYRSESKCFILKPRALDYHLQPSGKKENEVVSPDSTSNENGGNRVRRSNKIAMQGKIIKPWPLKKSLSVNNMYDKPCDLDFLRKRGNTVQTFSEGRSLKSETTSSSCASSFLRKNFQSSHNNRSHMEKIAEFSDEEDMDTSSNYSRSSKRVMRGEPQKDSIWKWTVLGMVIGISFTVNVFLGLNMWMKQNSAG